MRSSRQMSLDTPDPWSPGSSRRGLRLSRTPVTAPSRARKSLPERSSGRTQSTARFYLMNDMLDVLIVGAGPTGLTLAAQLHTYGLRTRIVDRLLDQHPQVTCAGGPGAQLGGLTEPRLGGRPGRPRVPPPGCSSTSEAAWTRSRQRGHLGGAISECVVSVFSLFLRSWARRL